MFTGYEDPSFRHGKTIYQAGKTIYQAGKTIYQADRFFARRINKSPKDATH